MNIDKIWSVAYRPQTLTDIFLSEDVFSYFDNIKKSESPNIQNTIFYGSAGGGKSSLARIIVKDVLRDNEYIIINASEENGIEIVRNKIQNFIQTRSFVGGVKTVILEEAESLSYSSSGGRSGSQNALKEMMEEYSDNARFIFTTNNIQGIIEPIISRCITFKITATYEQLLKRVIFILKNEKIKVGADQIDKLKNLVKNCVPDFRRAINTVQKCSLSGSLVIPDKLDDSEIIEKVYKDLIACADIFDVRKYIIENEARFDGDYRNLLKGLFNQFYDNYPSNDKKKIVLLILVEGLKDNGYVLDKEINFFGNLIKIEQLLCKK